MAVIPQQYTLHCITTGGNIPVKWYNESGTESIDGVTNRTLLHSTNGTYDNTLSVTWDPTNGSAGHHVYRCNVIMVPVRSRLLKVKSMLIFNFV